MYDNGEGVKRDAVRAVQLHSQACQADQPVGCINLGAAYEVGRGVPRDELHAVALYHHAARLPQGISDSLSDLARKREAKFTAACDARHWDVCAEAGVTYARGLLGAERDEAKAVEFFRKACGHESALGCYLLGKAARDGLPGTKQSQYPGLFKQACDLHDPFACVAWGVMQDKLHGKPKESAQRYADGCKAKVPLGCTFLGLRYDDGTMVDAQGKRIHDENQAARYFNKLAIWSMAKDVASWRGTTCKGVAD
jgi:TPR repeat protein